MVFSSQMLNIKYFNFSSCIVLSRKSSSYVKTANYPKIVDNTKKASRMREEHIIHDKYKALNTVEEKLFAVNLPKYYGWKSLILKEGVYPYKFLPFVQHVTRTKVITTDSGIFYQAYSANEDECKELLNKIRPQLQEAILFEVNGRRKKISSRFSDESNREHSDTLCRSIIEKINCIILANLSTSCPHLLESVIDYDPRLEAFWSVGGFHPSQDVFKEREGNKDLSDEEKHELVEHWIQYFGQPLLQIRNKLPLPCLNTEVINPNDKDSEVIPKSREDPSLAFGTDFERRYGTNIPGFWPGDVNEFGILSYHGRGYLVDRPPHFGIDEHETTVVSQAILAAFAWLHGQAAYQGFSTFHELTYPLVSQNVVTDGRQFSFFLYQLNTVLLHGENFDNNARINLCFNLPSAALYQDIKGSEILGWNDSVLATLISFYLNVPQRRENVLMKPYLKEGEQYLANIEEEERRIWLHDRFRHMYSNRPRHRLPYEIYDWERIYKVKFQTRPMDARFRPFELGLNPTEDRKYYDHMPPYIPRKYRSRKKNWTGWRTKFAKTYYPEI